MAGEGAGGMPAVLVVGAGFMGATHARAWRALGARVVCVADPDAERRAAVAALAEAHGCADAGRALAAHGDVAVVDVCVPTPAHLAVLEGLPPGLLVVMEKPLGRDGAEAAAVARTAHERGVDLFAAQVVRYFPAYRGLRDTVLARGAEGVRRLRMRRVGPPPVGAGGWFLDEARSGGIFIDLMVHDLDWLLWTFGPPARLTARAWADASGAARHALALLSWPGRRVAHVEGSWLHPGPFTTGAELDAVWGSAALGGDAAAVVETTTDGSRRSTPRLLDPYALELRAAWLAHQAGAPPPVSAEDGVRAVRLAEMCRESARLGRALAVDAGVLS